MHACKVLDLELPKFLQIVFTILVIIITLLGFYGLPLDFKVNAEYIIGVLAASSIVFGFWTMLIERKPKEETKKFLYEHAFRFSFFISLAVLVGSVVATYFTALDKLYSTFTLWICTTSFCFNLYVVAITLYYFKFKD